MTGADAYKAPLSAFWKVKPLRPGRVAMWVILTSCSI
jgi:hypothetical protein